MFVEPCVYNRSEGDGLPFPYPQGGVVSGAGLARNVKKQQSKEEDFDEVRQTGRGRRRRRRRRRRTLEGGGGWEDGRWLD
jgi:hypothetical protein